MTGDPESELFDFAISARAPVTEDETMVSRIHAALDTTAVPPRLLRAPYTKPAPVWHRYLNVATAAMLVIALIGASFSLLVTNRDTSDRSTSVPPVVLGLAGQASATPLSEFCDFSGDVPFFSGINASPIDGPTVLLTQSGELVRMCNGDTTMLLDGVKVAGPTMTPHVLIAITEDANHLLNIVSGAHIEIPNSGPQAQSSIGQQVTGPWVISASTNNMLTASVYELTSMAEIPILSASGDPVEIADLESAAVSSSQEHIAIAIPDDPNSINSALSGFFITDLSGDSRFTAVDDIPMPRQIAISPDGTTVATSSFEGTAFGGTTTIALLNAENGAIDHSWEFTTRDQSSELTWLRDGSMLILTDGTKLLGITPESPREGIVVFATADVMQGLMLTPNDQVVVIGQTLTPETGLPEVQTLIVNVTTGDTVMREGADMWSNPYFSATRSTLVLAQPSLPGAGDNPNLLVVEAATGRVFGEIDADLSIDSSFQSSSWGYEDGDIVTVAFSLDSMWRLVDEDGNPTLDQITPPPLDPKADVQALKLTISPKGYLSVRTYELYSAWVMLPGEDEWVSVPLSAPDESQGVSPDIGFIPGSG